MREKNPLQATLIVTSKCNSRCIMCDIWKNKTQSEMDPDEYLKLPSSLKRIGISGGEPYLRDDLPEIVKVCKGKNPNAQIFIYTNGLLPDRIEKISPKIVEYDRNIGIAVSLDGFSETHERIRGAKVVLIKL